MESLPIKLSEVEQRYFGELFSAYDAENQEKISGPKASELFLASQLPTEVLQQITELSGAKRLGHFGRTQFYIALKLIGAAQAGLPLKPEILGSGIDLPLPKFRSEVLEVRRQQSQPWVQGSGHTNFSQLPAPTQLPPPPKIQNKTTRQGNLRELECSPTHQLSQLPAQSVNYSAPVRVPSQPIGSRDSSPSELTDSPHGDKNWIPFHNPDGHLSWTQFEEHHHLLGTEEDSSEKHSSDEEFDIWVINEEQREYYTNQFRLMQPDLKGKITGGIAKEFFEKSKLPVQELSKIWQLSDIDKDGALTIEEFCTAMHLVVLRRNNIDIPEVLPSSLVPKILKILDTKKDVTSESLSHQPLQTVHPQVQAPVQAPVQTSPKSQTPTVETLSPQNKEWTKFNDSPTSSLSSPNMKPANFDFPAASVEQDPRILHPVAVRVSPDGVPLQYSNEQERTAQLPESAGENKTGSSSQATLKRGPVTVSGTAVIPSNSQQQCSTTVVSSEVNLHNESGSHPANSFSGPTTGPSSSSSQGHIAIPLGPKKEPPPPPPPRPHRNHARSSSLDLNRLGKSSQFLNAPPAVPPRVSPGSAAKSTAGEEVPSDDFADFDQFAESRSNELASSTQALSSSTLAQFKPSAFEVYKKPSPTEHLGTALSSDSSLSGDEQEHSTLLQESSPAPTDDSAMLLVDRTDDISDERKRHLSAPPLALSASGIKSVPRERWELHQALRAHRERNSMLSRLNNELNQELAEVMEERLSLEIQLDNLKPFSC